jgi:hypothetical protein
VLLKAVVAGRLRVVMVGRGRDVADGGEPARGVVELGGDALLDIGVEGGVGAQDQLAQHRHQRGVLAGQLFQFGPGGVDQPDRVVGEAGLRPEAQRG